MSASNEAIEAALQKVIDPSRLSVAVAPYVPPSVVQYNTASKPTQWVRQASSEMPETEDVFLGVQRLQPGSVSILKQQHLGSGAFGLVYKGDWRKRPVAIKEVNMEHAQKNLGLTREQVLETLLWEMSRLSTVNHSNLVQFYGIYEEEDKTYLVMEFCEGGNLQSILKKNPSWSLRWQWALQISQGLAYLHHQGILHRDLKAENVLLDKYGRARLADLGVAQVDALLQRKEALVVAQGLQDQRFKAPEALQSNVASQATDIYALGLVFWQLCTGKEPAILTKAIQKQMAIGIREAFPDDCPFAFKQLILECWQPDPHKRPSLEAIIQQLKGGALSSLHPQALWVKACEQIEGLVHTKNADILKYIPPYLTDYKVEEDIEAFWGRLEANGIHIQEENAEERKDSAEDKKVAKSVLSTLEQTYEDFFSSEQGSTLLLLGESGLGKSLSTYQLAKHLLSQCWQYLQNPEGKKVPYFPVLLRPTISRWHTSELQDAFTKGLNAFGIPIAVMREFRWLVIVDGYDECQADTAPQNLPHLLGLDVLSNAKLLVTCRPNTVNYLELHSRFAFNGQLTTRYFLPFNVGQLLSYLNSDLHWDRETESTYRQKIEQFTDLRAVLRNPFVLSLFAQGFETIVTKDLNQINRWQIYEGFVEHWFNTHQGLLSNTLQKLLQEKYSNLLRSFTAFAAQVAFSAFNQSSIYLEEGQTKALGMAWTEVSQCTQKDSAGIFQARQQCLSDAERRRAVLTEQDYMQIMQNRTQRFLNGLPLRNRTQYFEFSHKSFFDYFIAKRIIQLRVKEPEIIVAEGLELLNHRPIQEEVGALNFIVEGWNKSQVQSLIEPLFQMIDSSKQDAGIAQASANAATILNAVHIPFSGRDLTSIKIPGADLEEMVADSTNFSRADLRGVNLKHAFVNNSCFAGTMLENANFGEMPYFLSKNDVTSIALLDNNNNPLLIVGGRDGKLYIWDLQTAQLLQSEEVHVPENFSFLERLSGTIGNVSVACVLRDHFASGGSDGMIYIWKREGNLFAKAFSYQTDIQIRKIVCSNNNKFLALGGKMGLQIRNLDENYRVSVNETRVIVDHLLFSASDSILVSASSASTQSYVYTWDVQTGDLLARLDEKNEISEISFLNNENVVAIGTRNSGVILWGHEKNQVISRVKDNSARTSTNGMVFLPQKQSLLICNERGVQLLDINTHRFTEIYFYPVEKLVSIGVIAGRNYVAYCMHKVRSSDKSENKKQIKIMDVEKLFPKTREIIDVSKVVFDTKRSGFIVSSEETIYFFDPNTFSVSKVCKYKDRCNPAVSNRGKIAFLKGNEVVLLDTTSLEVYYSFPEEYQVSHLQFSSDGTLLAVVAGNAVYIHDVIHKKNIDIFKSQERSIKAVCISNDNMLLATGSDEKTVCLWDIKDKKILQRFHAICEGYDLTYNRGVLCLTFSKNNEFIVSGSMDGIIRIWNVRQGKLISTINGHGASVTNIKFSNDGRRLISGGLDARVFVWDISTGKPLQEIKDFYNGVITFDISTDDTWLAVGSIDRTLRIYRSNEENLYLLQWRTVGGFSAEFANTHDALLSSRNAAFLRQCGTIGTSIVRNDVPRRIYSREEKNFENSVAHSLSRSSGNPLNVGVVQENSIPKPPLAFSANMKSLSKLQSGPIDQQQSTAPINKKRSCQIM